MVLIDAADGKAFLCDCNVTEANAARVIAYLKHVLRGRRIAVFICTHRDADHMRGVNRIHRAIGIDQVWDCGLPGGNPSSPEGEEYMRMRRAVPHAVLRGGTTGDYGATRLHILSAADDGLPDDCNAQSIVIKVEQIGNARGSAILTGDSDVSTWKAILDRYRYSDILASEILLGSHHGSWTFFDVGEDGYYYPAHVRAINPAMTVISVGPNVHEHPHPLAVQMYKRHSRGSQDGHRVWRTDQDGTMMLQIHERDGWTLSRWQERNVPMLPPPPPRNPYAGLTLADLAGWGRPPLPPPPPPSSGPFAGMSLADLVAYVPPQAPPLPRQPRAGGLPPGLLSALLADAEAPPPPPRRSPGGLSPAVLATLLADTRQPPLTGYPPPAPSVSGFGRPFTARDQADALRGFGSASWIAELLRDRNRG